MSGSVASGTLCITQRTGVWTVSLVWKNLHTMCCLRVHVEEAIGVVSCNELYSSMRTEYVWFLTLQYFVYLGRLD
jgi:hypothetical protein